jgi:DinB family
MPKTAPPFLLPEALLHAFETNDRINQYVLESLPAESWRASPPEGKGRTIAAIVAHIHNVRVMWLKAAKGNRYSRSTRTGQSDVHPSSERHRAKSRCIIEGHKSRAGHRRPGKRVPPRRRRLRRIFNRPRRSPSRTNLHAGKAGRSSAPPESNVRNVGVGFARVKQ